MPDFVTIYAQHADMYDRLVEREDFHHWLLPALRQVAAIDGARVAEFGAGTGRLTRMLAPSVTSIVACDRSAHMLEFARTRLHALHIDNSALLVADNAAMPLAAGQFSLSIAGWSFGHTTEWRPDSWREEIGRAIAEMRRLLRPGGTAVIIETLGTGRSEPQPPVPRLADYYDWLEHDLGWRSAWVRTDYRFSSQAEAEELTGWFFGSVMPSTTDPHGRAIVPECTGIWWTQVQQ
jgi:ubiquinone/menaquinone biosynthesis C-methylase UbiE